MIIDGATFKLPVDEYFPKGHRKRAIVLHHTVGGSVASTVNWWKKDADPKTGKKNRVGTAFLVARDGTIFQVFPAEAWAIHLFRSRPSPDYMILEQETIGIEMASEGALVEKNGSIYAYAGQNYLGPKQVLLDKGVIVKLDTPWRGVGWFDDYDEKQSTAVIELVLFLCQKFGIPQLLPREADGPVGNAATYLHYEGVLHHAMVRPDKTDVHPKFPWLKLGQALGDPAWVGG